jgi:hypothetical protein
VAARFDVRICGGHLHDGIPFFEPFQEIAGTVEVEVDQPVECRGLAVRLIWHTEGRGDEDKTTIEEIDIFQGRLMPSYPVHASFRFHLPPQPWSFAGHYISIIWAVEVNVDVPMAADLRHRERLVMRPKAAR